MLFRSPANFAELADMGYTFINVGADVIALGNYFNDIRSKVPDKKIAKI